MDRDYFEYYPGKTADWWRKQPPPLDRGFAEELHRCSQGQLRVVWGGTEMSDVSAIPTLKYKATWRGLTGFYYSDKGKHVPISRPEDAPSGKLALPCYETLELGRLRWIIEYNESAEHVAKSGRLDQRILDIHGNPVFAKLTSEGLWNFFFCVETADGKYRGLDKEVLGVVLDMWHFHLTATIEQKMEAHVYAERRKKIMERQSAQNVWNSAPDKAILESLEEKRAKTKEFLIDNERTSNSVLFT